MEKASRIYNFDEVGVSLTPHVVVKKGTLHCACQRWIHENCTDEVIIDANGKERFCHIVLCETLFYLGYVLYSLSMLLYSLVLYFIH